MHPKYIFLSTASVSLVTAQFTEISISKQSNRNYRHPNTKKSLVSQPNKNANIPAVKKGKYWQNLARKKKLQQQQQQKQQQQQEPAQVKSNFHQQPSPTQTDTFKKYGRIATSANSPYNKEDQDHQDQNSPSTRLVSSNTFEPSPDDQHHSGNPIESMFNFDFTDTIDFNNLGNFDIFQDEEFKDAFNYEVETEKLGNQQQHHQHQPQNQKDHIFSESPMQQSGRTRVTDVDDIYEDFSIMDIYQNDEICGRPIHLPSENIFTQQPLLRKKRSDMTEFDAENLLASGFKHRIVGGTDAEVNSWPWSLLLTVCIDYGWTSECFKCGGILIDRQWAVTAAHCLPENQDLQIQAELGKHYTDTPATNVEVETYIIHENFKKNYKDGVGVIENDIGLIKFKKPIAYTDRIRPACLPDKDVCVKPNTVCVVTGWGFTDEQGKQGFPTQLQQAPVKIFDTEYCKNLPNYSIVNDKMICAGWENGEVDACGGDSGGPLQCRIGDSPDSPWVIMGTVSWGIGCARRNSPGVYTNLPVYSDWIQSKTNLDANILGKEINNGQCLGTDVQNSILDPTVDEVKIKQQTENFCYFEHTISDPDTKNGVNFGRVKSPNHPKNYGENSDCKWCFEGDEIKIRFRELKTNQKKWTCSDNLDKFDIVVDGQVEKSVCYWKHIRQNFVYQGKVCLQFQSRGYHPRKPMKYRFEYQITSKAKNLEIEENGGIDTPECPKNGVLTSVTPIRNVLKSPNFPNQYPDGLLCRWTLQSAVVNFPINFTVDKRSQATCNLTKIKISNSNYPAIQITRWSKGCQDDSFTIYSGYTCEEVQQNNISRRSKKHARSTCGNSKKRVLRRLQQMQGKTKYCIEFRSGSGASVRASKDKYFYRRQTKDSGFSLTYQSVAV